MSGELKTTVTRRVLGTNLRRLRQETGLHLEDAARELDCHPAKISRIESGRTGIRQPDLRTLLDLYGVKDLAARETWSILAREGRRQRWWRVLEDRLPYAFLELIGLEDEVATCRVFDTSIVPGLLQTEDYAAAIFQGGVTGPLNDEQRTKLEVRMRRQQALYRSDSEPLKVWAIIGEGTLRQQIGGATVLGDQLRHIAEVTRLPNVTIQVLPFTAGAITGGLLPFWIYAFPSPVDLEVVVLEQFTTHTYLEDRRNTEFYSRVFDDARAAALSPLDSEALILNITDELTHG